MQIEIPTSLEDDLKRRAAAAGCADVREYVLQLIAEDEIADPLDPSDPRLQKAIEDGFASGVEGVMDEAFWRERREKLESVISENERPAE